MTDLSPLIADEWQPIETAPKDSINILVWADGYEWPEVARYELYNTISEGVRRMSFGVVTMTFRSNLCFSLYRVLRPKADGETIPSVDRGNDESQFDALTLIEGSGEALVIRIGRASSVQNGQRLGPGQRGPLLRVKGGAFAPCRQDIQFLLRDAGSPSIGRMKIQAVRAAIDLRHSHFDQFADGEGDRNLLRRLLKRHHRLHRLGCSAVVDHPGRHVLSSLIRCPTSHLPLAAVQGQDDKERQSARRSPPGRCDPCHRSCEVVRRMKKTLEYHVHFNACGHDLPIAAPSNGFRQPPARFPASHLQPGGQDVVYRLGPQVRERQATQIEFAPGVYASSAPRGAQFKSCLHFETVAIVIFCKPLRAKATVAASGFINCARRPPTKSGQRPYQPAQKSCHDADAKPYPTKRVIFLTSPTLHRYRALLHRESRVSR